MWERLRRFSALERPARSLFLRATVLLPLVAVSLRWRGFRATQATLQRSLLNDNQEREAALVTKSAAMIAHMVNAADRHELVHPSCLAKSLTLGWLLARQGISSHLRIRMRKKEEKYDAHVWVEGDEIALNGPDEQHDRYAAFEAAFCS